LNFSQFKILRAFLRLHYLLKYWAEISQESEEIVIQFYPHPNEKCWEFLFDEALEVLEQAKKKLLG